MNGMTRLTNERAVGELNGGCAVELDEGREVGLEAGAAAKNGSNGSPGNAPAWGAESCREEHGEKRRHVSAPLRESADHEGDDLAIAREQARIVQEELTALIDALGDVVLILSAEGRYLTIFPTARKLLYRPTSEMLGRTLHEVLPREAADSCMAGIQRAINSGHVQCIEYALPFEDGEKFFDASVSPLPDDTVVWVARDVTEQKRARNALRQAEERYRSLFENAVEGIFQTTPEGRYVGANPALARLYGYHTPEELIASLHDIGQQLYVDPQRRDEFVHLIEEQGFVENFESQIYRKDGQIIWLSENARAVRDEDGNITRYEGFIEDISARKEAENQLRHDALHDRLTGLPNRALFMDRLGQAMSRARRHDGVMYAVLFLDMDRFKVVNDSLGHMAGDRLLVEMARRLERALRPGDTVARLGGDEFAVLLDELISPDNAILIAERVQEELGRSFELNGQAVSTSASIGIAMGDRRYERPEELLRDADMAMYRAKGSGKARHELFDSDMHARAVEVLKLESAMRQALERDEFQVFYQPIVSLSNQQVVGFEALLRWQHPERGIIAPGEFIPLAEETGLIVPIGRWVLREACRQLKEWHSNNAAASSLPTVSVNLSVKQFLHPRLNTEIADILREQDLDPRYLKLEITESALMGNAEEVSTMLDSLRSMGVRLGLDDFGTGYSSLSYLHRFSLDTLKIDRSFITGLEHGEKNQEIVRAIVTLAKNLGMDVVAEGVETGEQLQQLLDLSCRHGQGYLFSRPMDANGAEQILSASLKAFQIGDGL